MGNSARAWFAGLVSLSLVALLSGCAVLEERNRLTLNALDHHAAPASDAGRWAAAPVALPVSLMALAADALVVHPATAFDDAWRDTRDWLWTPDSSESRYRTAVLFPFRVVATPLIYLADWMARAAFAIDPNEVPPASEVR